MLTYPFDLEADRPKQLGLIVLQADETIEQDMRRLIPPEISLMVSRVPSGTHVTSESLAAMEAELAQSASLFPASAHFSAIGYGCTSGSAEIGSARVAEAIRAGVEAPHVTEPLSALIAACQHLDVERLGILSPYTESVSARLCARLEDTGIEVSAFASFNEAEECRVARIAPASIAAAATQLAQSANIDALFMSCTNLRTLDIIANVEVAIGVPVLTSNQVLAWHLLRLGQISTGEMADSILWRR